MVLLRMVVMMLAMMLVMILEFCGVDDVVSVESSDDVGVSVLVTPRCHGVRTWAGPGSQWSPGPGGGHTQHWPGCCHGYTLCNDHVSSVRVYTNLCLGGCCQSVVMLRNSCVQATGHAALMEY